MWNAGCTKLSESNPPHDATAPSGPGPPHYRGLTITHGHTTLGRTPLDERSSCPRDLHLITRSTHKRQVSMPSGGIRTRNPRKRAAADPRLRPRCQWGPLLNQIHLKNITLKCLCAPSDLTMTRWLNEKFKISLRLKHRKAWFIGDMKTKISELELSAVDLFERPDSSFFRRCTGRLDCSVDRTLGKSPGARLVVVTKRKIPILVYPESNTSHSAHSQSLKKVTAPGMRFGSVVEAADWCYQHRTSLRAAAGESVWYWSRNRQMNQRVQLTVASFFVQKYKRM